MIKVLFDTSPLASAHATRGIGGYTRMLSDQLDAHNKVELGRSTTLEDMSTFKPDVIHYPFFDLYFSTLPLRVTTPTVVTIHDLIPLRFPDHYKAGIKGKFRFERQKIALKTVNAIITDSKSSKSDIVELLHIRPEKVHVVYLAANPELQAQNSKICKKISSKYALPQKYILYVGDINYNKNIPQLIKMVRYLPDEVSLVCVGKNFAQQEIPEWQWIETQLALSDVANRVKFVTSVLTDSVEDLAAIYTGAVCYVQPSLYEGFGLPLLEAMQCRTPVVSTDVASLPEVGGEHAVYANPTAESLAKAVDTVMSWSKTKRQTVLRHAYKWSQSFSWEQTATKTIAVYESVLQKS